MITTATTNYNINNTAADTAAAPALTTTQEYVMSGALHKQNQDHHCSNRRTLSKICYLYTGTCNEWRAA